MLPPASSFTFVPITNPLTRVDLVTPVSLMNRLRLKNFFPKLHESNRQSLGFKTLTLPPHTLSHLPPTLDNREAHGLTSGCWRENTQGGRW